MNIRKACVISGCGSWDAFGGGTLERINKNYNTIVGVSTGSLLAPLTALKEWELLKLAYTNINNNDIFDKCWYKGKPIGNNGKLNKLPIIMSLLLGQKSVFTSNVLRKTIEKLFTLEYFDDLRIQKKEILVGTQNFSEIPSKIHYFSSMDKKYDEFLDWTWCSANFPFFSSLVKKSWIDGLGNFHVGSWSNGGLIDLAGLDQLNLGGYKEIDIILHRTKSYDNFEGNKINCLMDNVTTCLNGMRYDIEFDHFYEKIKRLNKQGRKVTIYWLPRKLSTNPMVYNRKEMIKWWDEGYETAFNPDRIEVFEPTKRRNY